MVALLALWGCGPEESAYDRDQKTREAQLQQLKAQYLPFKGVYTGTLTYINGNIVQVSLNITNIEPLSNNVTTGSAIATPQVSGTFNTCLDKDCFLKNPTSISSSSPRLISQGSYDGLSGILTLNTVPPPNTPCNVLPEKNCAQDTITIWWASGDHSTLEGGRVQGGSDPGNLKLVRRQP